MRKFSIFIAKNEWIISGEKKAKEQPRGELAGADGFFGFLIVCDGAVNLLGDYEPPSYIFELMKRENVEFEFLKEICEFTHEKHTFKGDFFAAFEYINAHFHE